ncbi:MAG: hypothetical protein JXA44_00010 [Methanospirillaceae archaeon]|nr:hypothetical protein [Methanospirillaceae archaeon]
MNLRKEDGMLCLDNRFLSDLDLFVSHVLEILSRYFLYVIVSGYVAILLGRTRSTEDVDILIPFCDLSSFLFFHDNCIKQGYEFLHAERGPGLYSLLCSGSAIRLCESGVFIPNIEIKFVKTKTDEYSRKKQDCPDLLKEGFLYKPA